MQENREQRRQRQSDEDGTRKERAWRRDEEVSENYGAVKGRGVDRERRRPVTNGSDVRTLMQAETRNTTWMSDISFFRKAETSINRWFLMPNSAPLIYN